MGIVVDFSQCTIDVEHDPDVLNKLKPFYQAIDKPRVVFPLMKFEAKFAFDFDPALIKGTTVQEVDKSWERTLLSL